MEVFFFVLRQIVKGFGMIAAGGAKWRLHRRALGQPKLQDLT